MIPLEGKNIMIVGWPSSGKTSLAKALSVELPNHRIIHTDDYNKKSSEEIIKILNNTKGKKIIEGVDGYRLLRKGYAPDVVMELHITERTLKSRYTKRGLFKLPFVKNMIAGIETIKSGIKKSPNILWINIQNDGI